MSGQFPPPTPGPDAQGSDPARRSPDENTAPMPAYGQPRDAPKWGARSAQPAGGQPAGRPGGQPAGPPVCPRHPDRVSYIRCQRCGRPVCPECQRPAPVGVQCVDCVRDAARRNPHAVSAKAAGRPVVTIAIVAICVVSWVLQLATNGRWTTMFAFSPALGEQDPYRFLTTAFLHGSTLHVLFNMLALWAVGPFLEHWLGHWRFAALYLLSAVGGSVGYLLLSGGPTSRTYFTLAVGASGAVFGLFGASLPVLRQANANAVRSMVALIAINFVLGFVIANVAWQAHVGGLVTGTLAGLGFAYLPKARKAGMSAVIIVGLLAIIVALAAGAYAAWG